MCQWFLRCTNEAAVLVAHPVITQGVPTCQRCNDVHDLKGEPLAHWEAWCRLLWNAALEAIDEEAIGLREGLSATEQPALFALLETMQGIAEDQLRFVDGNGNLAELK